MFDRVAEDVSVIKVPDVGRVIVVVQVVVRVVENAPTVAKVELLANVRVAVVAGAVIATLLTEVAVATPILGVVSEGEVAFTRFPVPVELVVVSAVPPPTAIEVAEAAPNTGVTKVGEVANTILPVPVELVVVSAVPPPNVNEVPL